MDGLRSIEADIDDWIKELAPSDKLRRWFAHKLERWLEFQQRYMEELSAPQKAKSIKRIAQMRVERDVTRTYAARDSEHNNLIVLEELIAKLVTNFA